MASTASSWLALNDLSLNTLLRILCTSSINGSEPLDARFSVKYSFKSSSSSEKASSESIVKTGFVGAGAGGAGGGGGGMLFGKGGADVGTGGGPLGNGGGFDEGSCAILLF